MPLGALVQDPETRLWPVTSGTYERLVIAGELDGRPVELLDGAVVELSPQGARHTRAVALLARVLDRALTAAHGERYLVLQHSPLVSGAASVPEPDIGVIDSGDEPWADGGPRGAHLVVEVAETSQRRDLAHKAPVYACAGVPAYWVVDLPARRVVVHGKPEADSYARVDRLQWSQDLVALGISLRPSEVLAPLDR